MSVVTSLNPVPNAQVCVYLTVHITKLQLQTTFPNLSIYHLSHVFIETLAAENLDVCTACDPWDSNIQLTMIKDWRQQIYPNATLNRKLTTILIYQNLGGLGRACLSWTGTHAGGGGVIYFCQGFLSCMMPSMDGWWNRWIDGWMEKASRKTTMTSFTICNRYTYI
jgi:hypothetical protein